MNAPPPARPGPVTADGDATWERYAAFLRAPPETVLEWNDPLTEARGWLVMNSLRGGAAGGGTRMRAGLGPEEVTHLAKVMELKFSIAGPPIGGAKSGIDFDPADPRKRDVLERWFRTIRPLLATRYATAGDLNVDDVREVAPLVRGTGLRHQQQGVAVGHFGLRGAALERRLRGMEEGLARPVDGALGLAGSGLRVSDLITGYGVAVACRRLQEARGGTLAGTRVLLEGFGNVGGAAALYLARWGARLVGIVDVATAVVSPGGLAPQEVESLLLRREGNRLPIRHSRGAAGAARRRFEEVRADLCVCAAASGTLDRTVLERLRGQGVEAIVCGANHPFAESSAGDTTIQRWADGRFAVVADFVANCGAAHAFAFQMARERAAPVKDVFASVEATVSRALDDVVERAGTGDRGLLTVAVETALERLTAP